MRDEAKVRSYRDALRAALTRPCDCAAAGHAAECAAGRMIIDNVVRALDWVLGEGDEMNDLVNHMIASAALLRL